MLTELYHEQLALFDDADAQKPPPSFSPVGETTPTTRCPAADLAALTVACQAILNLDAAIYER